MLSCFDTQLVSFALTLMLGNMPYHALCTAVDSPVALHAILHGTLHDSKLVLCYCYLMSQTAFAKYIMQRKSTINACKTERLPAPSV